MGMEELCLQASAIVLVRTNQLKCSSTIKYLHLIGLQPPASKVGPIALCDCWFRIMNNHNNNNNNKNRFANWLVLLCYFNRQYLMIANVFKGGKNPLSRISIANHIFSHQLQRTYFQFLIGPIGLQNTINFVRTIEQARSYVQIKSPYCL